jgi:hypothetical protein
LNGFHIGKKIWWRPCTTKVGTMCSIWEYSNHWNSPQGWGFQNLILICFEVHCRLWFVGHGGTYFKLPSTCNHETEHKIQPFASGTLRFEGTWEFHSLAWADACSWTASVEDADRHSAYLSRSIRWMPAVPRHTTSSHLSLSSLRFMRIHPSSELRNFCQLLGSTQRENFIATT